MATPKRPETKKRGRPAKTESAKNLDNLMPKKRGRKPGVRTVWNAERVKELRSMLEAYVEKTACPMISEFCYENRIMRQRLYDFPELKEPLDFLEARRRTYYEKLGLKLTKEHGSRGAFIMRVMGNMGAYSVREHVIEEKPEDASISSMFDQLFGKKAAK